MKIEEHIITVDLSKETAEPTHICLVCECKENPLADIAYSDKAWLCEKCKRALQKTVWFAN